MNRINIVEGHYVAALDWGHYAKIEHMSRYFHCSPMLDTHRKLISGGDETRDAHRVYHVQCRRYVSMGYGFDPFVAQLRVITA